jgi:hypothetical protein
VNLCPFVQNHELMLAKTWWLCPPVVVGVFQNHK